MDQADEDYQGRRAAVAAVLDERDIAFAAMLIGDERRAAKQDARGQAQDA